MFPIWWENSNSETSLLRSRCTTRLAKEKILSIKWVIGYDRWY